jgi:hypothetical protein
MVVKLVEFGDACDSKPCFTALYRVETVLTGPVDAFALSWFATNFAFDRWMPMFTSFAELVLPEK